MFDTAINSKPAFEAIPKGLPRSALSLEIWSNFADRKTKEYDDLALLFKTGTVDNFIEFAEANFFHIRKADVKLDQGSSLRCHFVLNKDELLKVYDGDGRQDYVLLPQYGFVTEEKKDLLSGESIFKNITFFRNDIVYSSSDILTSAKLNNYDVATGNGDISPATAGEKKSLYCIHVYK